MAVETHYDILGIAPDASPSEIKAAYKSAARQCHPDVAGKDEKAKARFEAVTKAYKVLSDPEKRRWYDQQVTMPQSVDGLLVRHASGSQIVSAILPAAPAESRPGLHMVRVVPAEASAVEAGKVAPEDALPELPGENRLELPDAEYGFRWGRCLSAGDAGKNGAGSGDLFLLLAPKK